jgi:hypothetical protein
VSRGEQKVSRGCLAGEQSGESLVIDPAAISDIILTIGS